VQVLDDRPGRPAHREHRGQGPDGLETALLDALRQVLGRAAAADTGVFDGELRVG
jgi:hypothetical protein